MKVKKSIVYVIIMIVITNLSNVSLDVKAGNFKNYKKNVLYAGLVSEKEQAQIDKLYEKRLKLCENYKKNKKDIERIDKKIEKLGAEEISLEEVRRKLSISKTDEGMFCEKVMVNIKTPSEKYVKWTSTRRIVTYGGTQYEIQELRAVPTSSRSKLCGTAVTKETRRQNIEASSSFLKSIIPTVMGMVPNKVGTIGTGISIYQACREYNKNLSSNAKIEDIKANSTITIASDYVFNYVKKVGYKDEGHQVLCYAGNNVNTSITTVIPMLEFKNKKNEYKIQNVVRSDSQKISSPKINNRNNTACANYVKHLKGKSMNYHYNVQKLRVKLLGKTEKTIQVPKPNYGF